MVGTGTFPWLKTRIDNIFTKIMLLQVQVHNKGHEAAQHCGRRQGAWGPDNSVRR